MPARDDYLRSPKRMHRIFALSTILMFIAFLWMMVADHTDEWRVHQSVFNEINVSRLKESSAQIDTPEFRAQLAALETEQEAARQKLNEEKSQLEELESRIASARLVSDNSERLVKDKRAFRDQARANYDLAIANKASRERLDALQAEYERLQSETNELELEAERKKTVLDDLRLELSEATRLRDAAARRLNDAQRDLKQKQASLDRIAPSGLIDRFKREIMGWPIIDGFNSHYAIQLDWIPGLKQKLGMTSSARFDRCGTCHLGISDVQAGNVPSYPHSDHPGDEVHEWVAKNEFPHPYSTHPNPDLYLTATSPHSREKFGCTICHEGQGSGTSFQNAAHGPNDPIQEHEWAKKFGYFDNHFWEYPMLPSRFTEAHCIKCHHNVTELGIHPKFGASAPKVFNGYEIVKSFGCFGCHEIHGYAGADPIGPDLRLEPQTEAQAKAIEADRNQIAGQLRKVGPSLRHLASKTSRGWIEDWMKDPQNFRPETRMPKFFDLTNQQDEQAQRYQPVEIAAVTQFLLKNSEDFETIGPEEGYQPDAERGKLLFSQKGCMACHSNSAFEDLNPDFGPNLDKIHAKLPAGEQGFRWLYTWIKQPTHYHPRTKMPDLYLDLYTEEESMIDPAADIAAWLLEKDSQEWPEIEVDEEALDELVALFLEKKVLKSDQFKQFMETRDLSLGGKLRQNDLKGDEVELWTEPGTNIDDAEWKRMKLNFIGRRTVSHYGCYGCHDISGFEEARPIGVALQDWGRKSRTMLAPEHIHEFLHAPEVEYLVVPLGESENAAEILAGINSPAAFRKWVGERAGSLPAPITEKLRHGDFGKTIGDFAEHHQLNVNQWTEEPYEYKGQTYLILAVSSRSTEQEVKKYLQLAESNSFASEEERENGLSVAYLYQNLLHHGRAGFAWQKLRQPRSYDFEKISTKGYDERLRMPKFPFSQKQIEAVTTFVLGLVAEPPAEEYLYRPDGPAGDRIAGEKLLAQFNCTGCHVVENPKYSFTAQLNDLPRGVLGEPIGSDHAMSLLNQLAPPHRVSVPGHLTQFPFTVTGELSDVIDDLGETPERWQDFVTAHGATAEERVKAIGYKGDSDPAEWEFYVTSWDNLIVERQPLSGQIVHLGAEGSSDSLTVKLTADGSINAVLRYSANDRRLSAVAVGETEDDVLDVAAVEMTLDVDGGIHRVKFEPPAPDSGSQAHTFQSEEIFRNVTSLREIHGEISVKFSDVQITPSSRFGFVGENFAGYTPGRGGEFSRWLVDSLIESHPKIDKTDDGWNFVAPPLIREGAKVQTPWLYRFLREPEKLRYLTVLRMPKFNMSAEEARILANYFAAVDGTSYPYQPIPQKEPPYLAEKNREFEVKYDEKRTDNYLSEAWQMMMQKGNVCIGCHSVAGRDYLSSAKAGELEVRGPDLRRTEERLQPDWTLMWIYYPKWSTPYTKMPVNYALDKPSVVPIFDKDPDAQTKAVRDALMNHALLLEREGVKIWELPASAEADDADTNKEGNQP